MKDKHTKSQEDFDDKCRFIIKLGKAAHGYGSPAIRLEAYLVRLTKTFGLEGEFHSTPTDMIFAFREREGDWQKLHLTSVPGGLDLTKLPKLDEIVDKIVAGNLSIADAESLLIEVDKSPDPYGNAMLAFGYVALGTGIACLFSGSWIDILFSSILSLVVYAMVWQGGRKGGWVNDLIPLSTAFVAGVLAAIIKHFIPELNYVLVTLSAIVVLIPGYSVSLGVAEIVNNHVVSGFTNLINGVVYLFKQFVGAWLAFTFVNAIWATPTASATPVDPMWLWVFVPAIFMGLIIVFQTAPRYILWAFVSCLIGYLGVVYGGDWLGSNMGNMIGAALVGMFANVWKWKSDGNIRTGYW